MSTDCEKFFLFIITETHFCNNFFLFNFSARFVKIFSLFSPFPLLSLYLLPTPSPSFLLLLSLFFIEYHVAEN